MYRGITRAAGAPAQILSKAAADIANFLQTEYTPLCESLTKRYKAELGLTIRFDFTTKPIQEVIASWTIPDHEHPQTKLACSSLQKGDFSQHYEMVPHIRCVQAMLNKFDRVMTFLQKTSLHHNLHSHRVTATKCTDRCATSREHGHIVCINRDKYKHILDSTFRLAFASFSDLYCK